MTPTFVAIAAAMILTALAALVWPLLRVRSPVRRRWPALIIATLILPLSVTLYATWSNWDWTAAPTPVPPQSAGPVQPGTGTMPDINAMLARLEARLQTNPEDPNGWLMLGRSYFQLNRYYKSADAYEQAYRLTQGKSVEAIVGLGEALSFADDQALTNRGGKLFDEALALEPKNAKALWYGGLSAYQTQNYKAAKERWSALVALNPPPEVKKILEKKLAEIEQHSAAGQ